MNNIDHPINQINFDKNGAFLIEASAGTGKTWTLERLYIKALLEGSNSDNEALGIENILVVTFTKDAVHELKVRIYAQLQKTTEILFDLYNNEVQEQVKDYFTEYLKLRYLKFDIKKDLLLLNRAMQNFDVAAIYTIHKFCSRIISNYPIYFNVDFHSDKPTDKFIVIRSLITNFIREKIINNSLLNKHIETVLNNVNVIFEVNYKLSIEDAILKCLPKDLFEITDNGVDIKYSVAVKPDLSFLTEIDKVSNADANDKITQSDFKARILSSVIEYLKNHYPPKWKQLGGLSYDELIQAMAFSIENSPELCDLLYTMYPITFIDEFQDTDSLQWQIFSSIYNDTKRGNLVVVGDPKQAIYSFRGADIAAYINAKKIISTNGHNNLLALNSNFRSHPNIMNFVNLLFDRKSHENEYFLGEDIDYLHSSANSDINQHRIPDKGDIDNLLRNTGINQKSYDENVQIVVVEGKSANEREQNTILNMTFEILTLLPTDKQIAVLVSNNNQANKILKYFHKYGIRASELKTSNIYASKSAVDLFIILDALLNLDDEAKVMKALITDILGVEISRFDKINSNILEFKKYLFAWKMVWEQNGILALTYSIIGDIRKIFQHKVTNRDLSNILQLAELLNIEAAKIPNQTELLTWFMYQIHDRSENLESSLDNSEELMRLDNDDEQVIITTHHKAKGLEYDIVFCPFFRKNPKINDELLNKKLPYFKGYYENSVQKNEMITERDKLVPLLQYEDKETQRLNYVALTRAKSRLYIYLKQHTISYGRNYHANENPEKLVDLFGYKRNNINDRTHSLFNYPDFFGVDKSVAFKDKNLFSGIVAYTRGVILESDLIKLKILQENKASHVLAYKTVNTDFVHTKSFQRQSYTSITHKSADINFKEHYENNVVEVFSPIKYRYRILNDVKFSGAIFGTLFHELCEEYPISLELIKIKLSAYNVGEDYANELYEIINLAFKHPLHAELPNLSLHAIPNKMFELKFNITVKNTLIFKERFSQIVTEHFGEKHKFSIAVNALDIIESGFLGGAIDLFFEYKNKYWILDYKTNKLADYTSVDVNKCDNQRSTLIDSMAEHHYYLQYIIYLVVIKRHLEQRLNIVDASDMLGGAIYYYVRGLYTDEPDTTNSCVYIDSNCQKLISRIDKLLRNG